MWSLCLFAGMSGVLSAQTARIPERFPELASDRMFHRPFFFCFDDAISTPPDGRTVRSRPAPSDDLTRAQYLDEPTPDSRQIEGRTPEPRSPGSGVFDPPVSYGGPDPSRVEDIEARDGPRIPEPMVFDLVRGLGARRGELEFNTLSLVPFRHGGPKYEWAPEIEWAVADGFAVEYELPIFDTRIVAQKFAPSIPLSLIHI